MLGENINLFDALPENEANLETFNMMFNMEVKGDLNAPVEILGLHIGGLRKVIIGGTSEFLVMTILPDYKKNKKVIKNVEYKYRFQIFKNNVLLGEYKTALEISKKYKVHKETVRAYMKNGRTNKRGYSFKQILNPEY